MFFLKLCGMSCFRKRCHTSAVKIRGGGFVCQSLFLACFHRGKREYMAKKHLSEYVPVNSMNSLLVLHRGAQAVNNLKAMLSEIRFSYAQREIIDLL